MDSDSDLEDEPHVKLVRIYKSRQVMKFSIHHFSVELLLFKFVDSSLQVIVF